MNRQLYRTGIWMLWLALPLTALRYWQTWDRLPGRMVTHFDFADHPNGWMSRESSFWFSVGLTVFLLAIFTVVLYLVQKKQEVNAFSWGLLAFFYLVIGLIYSVNSGLIDYNLYGLPINPGPFIASIAVGIVALIALYFFTQRGAALPATDVIAEEVHSGRACALVLGLPALAEIWIATIIPQPGTRLGVALVGLVLLMAAAMAWSGFRYSFSRHGLEIRTLGMRLRSIPSGQIKEYAAERWNPLFGYGIRGVGQGRAYVWANQGVHIKTTAGEFFLGHREPGRIIRDLDMMMGFLQSQQI